MLSFLVVVYPFPAAWPLGTAAIIMGGIATQQRAGRKMAWIACTIGFLAACGATFIYTLLTSS